MLSPESYDKAKKLKIMQNDQDNSQPLVAPKSDVGGSIPSPAPTRLKYFTQSEILQQIGIARLFKLLDEYADDLKGVHIVLPTPGSERDDHFDVLAATFASPELLPERLRAGLFALEEAAAPENRDRLQAAIEHRIPSVSLASCCPLDCALELWFAAPDELSQFEPAELSTINSPTLNSVALTVGPLPPAGDPFNVRCSSPARTSMFDVQSSSSSEPSTINSPTLNSRVPPV